MKAMLSKIRFDRIRDLAADRPDVTAWLAAVLVVTVLLAGRGGGVEYPAIARAKNFEVSPVTAGIIERVTVDIYETIDAGDMVAVLGGAPLAARLATEQAVLEQLRAELVSAGSVIRTGVGPDRLDWRDQARRFAVDAETLRLDRLALEVTIENDKVTKQRLGLARQRMADLREQGIVSEAEFDEAHLLYQAVLKRLKHNRILLAETGQELRAALARQAEFDNARPGAADSGQLLAPFRASIAAQEKRLDEIRVERERLVLRAPISGQISQVLALAGQSVLPGEPVAMVSPRYASEAIAYLPEHAARMIRPEQPVRVSTRGRPMSRASSFVLRVSPTVEALPERLWQRPGLPEYGRPFTVAVGSPLEVLPGEALSVRIAH